MKTFLKAIYRLRNNACESLIRKIWLGTLGSKIGKNTSLSAVRATWPHQVQIGNRCILEPDIFFKFDGIWSPGPSILIGDGVFIGRGCEFNIRRKITVGKGCAIASGCKFIDHDHGITGGRIDETPGAEAEIVIGDYAWLGCNVVVLKGVVIGPSAVVGAGAVVTKNIPTGEIWGGVPAHRLSSRQERTTKNNNRD